jgi:endonuclease-3 related protein
MADRADFDLVSIYDKLFNAYGQQHWWPGLDPFEICVGAILTQAVAWKNVEKAITALKDAGMLSVKAISKASLGQLAQHIRPTIYYNEKARKLQCFTAFLQKEYDGRLERLFALSVEEMRDQLLRVRGIGQETADSIILYAAKKPSFVVDAYTRRVLKRLGLINGNETYGSLRKLFMTSIPSDVKLYNEYHALLVRHAKQRCRLRSPLCLGCPLNGGCVYFSKAR